MKSIVGSPISKFVLPRPFSVRSVQEKCHGFLGPPVRRLYKYILFESAMWFLQ
ncbi:hypothetical protein C1H46_029908 [Malus baccata]|uniref:Uncharacterized protein n=1 Tax=Malus baccata TaxID=106549 RepID=A0A540LDL7_MALBA|nr:hypothetical protein C1H46_029908 [Malus baccata]